MEFGDLDWYHRCPEFEDVCVSCDLKFFSPNGLYECGHYILRLSLSLERLYNLDFNPLFIVSQSSRSSMWQSFVTMKALSLIRIV
jgi:hypothetical protein